ncbi:MAG: phage holin family protein, partial [Paracoccus sp. (in: a-proteobacteria)]|nr:phage holin family protein [Paracoccus sp. (in: a-proteobacteria)]
MFDYVNKLQLALGDKARRTSLKAGAGVVALIGVGFLLAALWSWLAWNLDLGPAMASLMIGGAFAVIGLGLWAMSRAERHAMPATEELRREVEARLSLATDAALDKARFKAEETLDSAQERVVSLIHSVEDRARGFVGDAEARVYGFANRAGGVAGSAARSVGLTEERLRGARDGLDRAARSRAAPGVGLLGAFAVGLAIAGAISRRGSSRDNDDPD